MGLFSYVNLELPCPYCGKLLKEFQSKDGILMQRNEPWTLDSFYDYCSTCNKMIRYEIKGEIDLRNILIHDGMEAINLLREYVDLESKNQDNYGNICTCSEFHSKVINLLERTKYPNKDNWLSNYKLRE